MSIREVIYDPEPENSLQKILRVIHEEGPVSSGILEKLALYKKYHNSVFELYEQRILSTLGLFYKVPEPSNLYSFFLSGFGKQNKKQYGEYFTPVQASVRRAVDENSIISVSAPTSAGKSYSIRDFISGSDGGAVVVVPSRALIAEYVNSMKRKFQDNKRVMISPFVDDVFKSRELRRIFILTPERARDLFANDYNLSVKVFFFDEAQISEEKERGVIFDILIRRIKRHYPSAKLIFAHPFVDNPEAQLRKHSFPEEKNFARSYSHGAVGKIFLFEHKNKRTYIFSPFIEKGHQIRNCVESEQKFSDFAFDGSHSVLVYVSKASIYNGKFIEPFSKYVDRYEKISDGDALEVIGTIEHLLGADEDGHNSEFVDLLKKGVVIHHGSVPLEVRFLIEKLIRNQYVKICFATSTLAQGVNMPFDIVWLDNMRILGESDQGRALAFKNLIGRAGRLSVGPRFDFGYVFTKNAKLLSERLSSKFVLKEKSLIDDEDLEFDFDTRELIDSIKNDDFDDQKQAPKKRVERLTTSEVIESCSLILNIIFSSPTIKESVGGRGNRSTRAAIEAHFKKLFEVTINRNLEEGEGAVFRQAISIFLQVIQGRSFREIVGIRYAYISKMDGDRNGIAEFSQPAERLPNINLKNAYSLFRNDLKAKDVSYDAVVFDTYDYLDQVISFSLNDKFITIFKVYRDEVSDYRADRLIELLRFGTNDSVQMLLMRYGFPPEDVYEISKYIDFINEDDIIFKRSIQEAPKYLKDLVAWYMP